MGRRLLTLPQNSTSPPDIWIADNDLFHLRKVTMVNPQLKKVKFGRTQLITYKGPTGQELRGAILMPPEDEERPYPLIVYLYPGWLLSNNLNIFGLGTLSFGNAQLLASRGFCVLCPDMTGSRYDILADITPVVMAAVNRIIETGIADPDKLGLMGHSAGGYCVNVLVTQTDQFAAAVSTAGSADAISSYGYFWINGRTHRQREQETIYEGAPWEVPEKYVENSPIFYLDKVNTPLLLIHGVLDETVGWHQSGEMFAGLRRLGKETVLVLYRDEGHNIGMGWSPNNTLDLWHRMIDWFEKYLRDK